ncbi:MAG: hypothetical protein LM600_03460 [Thaumarchaeota archaeon]|nr:hypothetical protein [Nitrososphaerota archaeon]
MPTPLEVPPTLPLFVAISLHRYIRATPLAENTGALVLRGSRDHYYLQLLAP